MKFRQKLATLLRSKRPAAARRRPALAHRPTPLTDQLGSLDPADAWGLALSPAGRVHELLAALLEQLALEAYLNGPAFEFGQDELEARIRAFFEQRVAAGDLRRESDRPPAGDPAGWLALQSGRIGSLVAWWRQQGGPDIEPRLL